MGTLVFNARLTGRAMWHHVSRIVQRRRNIHLKLRMPDHVLEHMVSGAVLAHLQASLMLLASGLWIGWPFFRNYESESVVYMKMTAVLPPGYWGAAFSLLGVANLVLYWRGNMKWLLRSALASAILWGATGVLLLSVQATGWATMLCPVIALGELVRCAYIKQGWATWCDSEKREHDGQG